MMDFYATPREGNSAGTGRYSVALVVCKAEEAVMKIEGER